MRNGHVIRSPPDVTYNSTYQNSPWPVTQSRNSVANFFHLNKAAITWFFARNSSLRETFVGHCGSIKEMDILKSFVSRCRVKHQLCWRCDCYHLKVPQVTRSKGYMSLFIVRGFSVIGVFWRAVISGLSWCLFFFFNFNARNYSQIMWPYGIS